MTRAHTTDMNKMQLDEEHEKDTCHVSATLRPQCMYDIMRTGSRLDTLHNVHYLQ